MSKIKTRPLQAVSSPTSQLFDPWAQFVVPPFPFDILSPLTRQYVESQSAVLGADPSAVAGAALGAISGALDHRFALKMMRHGDWFEHPRLWLLLVGPSSWKKTPIFDAVTVPLEKHQASLYAQHHADLRAYAKAKKDGDRDAEKPEPPPRYVVWNTTTEKCGELLSRSAKGLLVKADEVAGWIGQMEKYSNNRAGADRAFWLKSWDGGAYQYDRLNRGEIFIANLSVTMLGGIQPQRLAELRGLTSDGLLQRFIPVMMQPPRLAMDRASNSDDYRLLMRRLIQARPQQLTMTDDALAAMTDLRQRLHDLTQASGGLAEGFEAFVGKLDGLAGRLALILHLAADPTAAPRRQVEASTVEDVERLVLDYIVKHALEFYRSAEEATEGDRLKRLASYVLTSGEEELSARDLIRNVAHLRGLPLFDVNRHVSVLVAAGWLIPHKPGPDNRFWKASPAVQKRFAERRQIEERRKTELAKLMGSPRLSVVKQKTQ